MALLHPSGGLRYHLRAWRRRRGLWAPFHAEVRRWLTDWRPSARHLVLVGPSGGCALTQPFLACFDRITALEPDPLARAILRRRFPAITCAWAETAGLLQPDGFANLAARYPDAAFLFCNLLGQTLVGQPADFARAAWLAQLAPALQGRCWASWHDLASSPRRPDRSGSCQAACAPGLEEVLALFWQGGELQVIDHETAGLCPQWPRTWHVWQLAPRRYHLIEWLHSPA